MSQDTAPLPLTAQSFADPDVAALLAQLDAMDLAGDLPVDPAGGGPLTLLGIVDGIRGLFDFG